MIAQMVLRPGGIIAWLLVGLLAGWLAGVLVRGRGYGCLVDTVLGLVGAFIGGLVFSFFVEGEAGFWGSIGIAFIGACILIALARAVAPRRPL
jgi:uncharacterized membrane protein YeaQ/YmgE (transglycosylase-associated protein family)